MKYRWNRIALALALAALAGCSNHTQLVVSVDTDYAVPGAIDRVTVEVTGPSGTTRTESEALADATQLPRTLTIVPASDALGPVDIRATGWRGDTRVVSQDATVTLESGRSLWLPMWLGRDCEGVTCGASETCQCGDCVTLGGMPREWAGTAASGDPCGAVTDAGTGDRDGGAASDDGGNPSEDGGPGDDAGADRCMTDAECDDGIDCTTDLCAGSTCEHTADDAACTLGMGGSCIEGFGCQYEGCSPTTCVAGPCETARCDGATCVLEPACGDGEECCAGECVPAGCEDGNVCTDDACGASGCEHTDNTAVCDDSMFCNGADRCSDGICSEHAGDPCGGSSVCDESASSCTGCLTDADCPGDVTGPWGSCSYASTCSESGTRQRTITSYMCVDGVCDPSSSTDTGSCSRSTGGDSCGSTSFGSWGGCGGYSGPCGESGTRTRTRTDRVCRSGTCRSEASDDTGSCSRDTDGDTCDTTDTSPWSVCGDFRDVCANDGTRSRSVTEYRCVTGSCTPATTAETGNCSRDTDGDTCDTPDFGAWSLCLYTTCAETGRRTRTVTVYECASESCVGSTDNESDTTACNRDTEGDSCQNLATCQRGSCESGSCAYSGPGCTPDRCCEPGICSDFACP